MKHLINYLAFAAFLLPLGLSAKVKLADYLPAHSWAVVEVENLDALRKDMEKGPFGEMWNKPAMEKIRNLFDESMMDLPEGEEGEAVKELFDRLKAWMEKSSGQMAFSVGGLEGVVQGEVEDEEVMPEIIFLAETEATPKELAELLEWIEETDDKVGKDDRSLFIEKSKVRGHEVFWLAPEGEQDEGEDARIGAFVIDGVLGLGGGRSTIEELIERLVKKDGESIAENADYRDAFDEIGRGDLRVFVNFRPMIGLLDLMRDNEKFQIEENPLGVTTEGIIDALGLDGLECLALQMDFDKRGMEIGTAMFMGKRKGLLRLLQSSGKAVSPVPFIPGDATTASVTRYDLGLMWDTVMDLLRDVSPALHVMADAQIKAFEKQAGVSLRKDVLGSLGDEFVSFSEIKSEKTLNQEILEEIEANLDAFIGEFYAISLKDGERFDKSLRTLINAITAGAELFDEREHKGVVVRTLRDQTAISFSYAVTPKWLFLNVGERARILKAISRSKKPRKSLWKRPDVAAALEDLPNEYNSLEYLDIKVLVDLLGPLLQDSIEESTGERLDLGEMPDFPFFLLGWGREVDRGMVGEIRLFPKDE